ncbi:helix-turn-helix domain-containing protein [Tetragenococcus halophilus]|uniref:helix-turn-helix domain-containing protein n=1 Tax=Tetragenococcus halophilus TaxID=51669 RepID=UPI00209408BA|nr:helix-turn-helix domain-containing protein [Tetragenococcus halophilus]MCO7026737.1 helix-turn-helix domain-containing protein [Tetragenococcus halophilus]
MAMFIKSKGRFLVRDILNVLEEENGFLTMQQIAQRLEYPSIHSVKNTCHDLKKRIDELYSSDDIEFIISQRGGVRMKRNKVNLHLLTQAINESSVRYNTTLSLLINRELVTLDYCEKNFISKSTLVRKMRRTSRLLSHYGLNISISDRIKLTGKESMVRIGEFIFLTLNYESLSAFLFYPQDENYLQQTNQVFHYLNLSLAENEIEYLAIWFFVNQYSIEEGYLLDENFELLNFFEDYEFIEKPHFLSDWSENNWKFFLLFLYTMDYISLEKAIAVKKNNPFAEEINQWIACFEEHYFVMDKNQKEITEKKLTKQLQYDAIIKPGMDVMPYLENLDVTYLQERFPIYFSHFEKFWKNFTDSNPIYAKRPSAKLSSILNCIYFVPLLTYMPEVSIFVCTNTSKAHQYLLKEKIHVHLRDRVIKFEEDIHLADIIVTTLNSLEVTSEKQTLVQIRPASPTKDLARIKAVVETRVQTAAKNHNAQGDELGK